MTDTGRITGNFLENNRVYLTNLIKVSRSYRKVDKFSDKLDAYQVENINADNRLLNEIQSIREGVVFVNRKVADAEL